MSATGPLSYNECIEFLNKEATVLATVMKGRGDKNIAVVTEGDMKGMVVLFKNPPADDLIGKKIMCTEYEIRESKTGKQYIKCFLYILPELYEEIKTKCKTVVAEKTAEKIASEFPEKYRDTIKNALLNGLPDTAPEDILVLGIGGILTNSKHPDEDVPVLLVTKDKIYMHGFANPESMMFMSKNMLILKHPKELLINSVEKIPGARYISDFDIVIMPSTEKHNKLLTVLEKINSMSLPADVERELTEKVIEKLWPSNKK